MIKSNTADLRRCPSCHTMTGEHPWTCAVMDHVRVQEQADADWCAAHPGEMSVRNATFPELLWWRASGADGQPLTVAVIADEDGQMYRQEAGWQR